MKNRKALRTLTEGGLIAALYAALTLVVAPVAYGLFSFRVSELLTILPIFTPAAIPGLTLGCILANLVGFATGMNLAGAWDILFGSLATLLAAFLTHLLRGVRTFGLPVAATLPPVIINALVVGLELTLVMFGFSWPVYATSALMVGAGELLACSVCGLLLYTALTRSGADKRIFASGHSVL